MADGYGLPALPEATSIDASVDQDGKLTATARRPGFETIYPGPRPLHILALHIVGEGPARRVLAVAQVSQTAAGLSDADRLHVGLKAGELFSLAASLFRQAIAATLEQAKTGLRTRSYRSARSVRR
jgi:hypothetical protein